MPELSSGGDRSSETVEVSDCGGLCDPERLSALAETGLTSASDPTMEAFAARVRQLLAVPVALVSLVREDRQVFPGMTGLPEPWAGRRSTPLTHSFCRHVVTSAEPLVVEDARDHELVRDNLAVAELGVVAYAGMPLTDGPGNVLGSLCAIDSRPRRWSGDQLDLLRDLAAACSTELRLRLARVDADRERRHRDQLDAELRRAFARSQTLLEASQAFSAALTVEEVRDRIGLLVHTDLAPDYVGLSLLDDEGGMHRLQDALFPAGERRTRWVHYALGSPLPTATAVRENRVVSFRGRAEFDAAHPEAERRLHAELGLEAVVAVPLPGPEGPVGAFVLGWHTVRDVGPADQVTITTIAGYAAQALARARVVQLERQAAVATRRMSETLQRSLLTQPFEPDHLELAVRYVPATADTQVGGDWYDAFLLRDGALSVVIGDVAGHDREAVAAMGQLRNLLRGIAYSLDAPPATILGELDGAIRLLSVDTIATALYGRVEQPAAHGAHGLRLFRWTNAGHPPPLLVEPDGTARLLHTSPDLLLGARPDAARADHTADLRPGATLLLYTDGLVERRGADLDEGFAWLAQAAGRHAGRALDEFCDALLDEIGERRDDDVALLALRAHPEDRPLPPEAH
ncbi:GAF domain-containing SpoIIE family protein phosphatase [Pseudonocardia pini]|uniref:GAF domain-containing SpoIIE family protein phosphatase n=1 Tax=Pseudonocardia pini TaxID=2758030 RepID=UPI0015F02F8B|nr:SpoIIE family protein phosphatase [Pseudonocardia pini]